MDKTRLEDFHPSPDYFDNRKLMVQDPHTHDLEDQVRKLKEGQQNLIERKKEVEDQLEEDYKDERKVAKALEDVGKHLESLDHRIDQYENQQDKSMMRISILAQHSKRLEDAKLRASIQKKEVEASQLSRHKSLQNFKITLAKRKGMEKLALDYSKYSLYKQGKKNYYNRLEEKYHNNKKRFIKDQEDLINKKRNKLTVQYTENLLRVREASNAFKSAERVSKRIAKDRKKQLQEIKQKEKEILRKMEEEGEVYKSLARVAVVERDLEDRYRSLTYISPPEKKKLPAINKTVVKKNASYVFDKKKNDSKFNASQTTAIGDDEDNNEDDGKANSNQDSVPEAKHPKNEEDPKENGRDEEDELKNGIDEDEVDNEGYQREKIANGGQGKA